MEAPEEKSKLDPRVVRTRELIAEAMEDLLQENTLSEITVRDIAERATINRSTFYAHHADKYDLFGKLIRGQFQAHLQHQIPKEPGLTPDKLRGLILALCEVHDGFLSRLSLAKQQVRGMIEIELQAQVQVALLSWQPNASSGEHASVLGLHASLISWGVVGAVSDWARRSDRESATDFAARLASLLELDHLRPSFDLPGGPAGGSD